MPTTKPRLNITLEPDILERIWDVARANKCSCSAVVVLALKQFFKKKGKGVKNGNGK